MKFFSGRSFRNSIVAAFVCGALAAVSANAQQSPQVAPVPTAAPDDSNALAEITVTAARREETAQRAALDLAVVSGDEIQSQGVSQPEDLIKLVPGIKLTNGTTTSIYVRGVGETSVNLNTQSAIAVSVDGVYIGRTSAVNGNFFDLQRVELLKGPQGTLYGRNASGGALNLITNKPTDDFGGYVIEELGDYDLHRTTAAVNLPVSSTLAFRIAVFDSKHDGYNSDGTDDENQRAGRLHALWKPNSDVSLLWTVDDSHIGGNGAGNLYYTTGSERIGSSTSPQALATRAAQGLAVLGPQGVDIHNWSTSGQLDWNLGFATLTVQPGYRHQEYFLSSPGIVSPGNAHQYTGEMRLSHSDDKFKYVVGLYTFDEFLAYNYHLYQDQGFNLDTYQQIPEFDTRSKAAFGEATYSVTERFRVTGGIRRTDESRNIQISTNWYGAGFFGIPPADGGSVAIEPITGLPTGHYAYAYTAERTFLNTSGKVGLEFDVAPESLLYATLSTGFKSGGFSISPPPTNIFLPEKLTAFTVGMKNRFLNDSLQLNVEAFDWHYTNQQVSHLGFDINGAAGFVTDNAGSSNIRGGQIDTTWRATHEDTISLTAEYLWAYFKTYTIVVPFPDKTGCSFTPTTVFGRNVLDKDCSGFRLPFTPKYSGTLNYSHQFSLGDRGSLTAGSTVQFATQSNTDVNLTPLTVSHGYVAPDADLTYRTPENKLFVTTYVRNITDKQILNGANTQFIPATVDYRAPRTFGVQIGVHF